MLFMALEVQNMLSGELDRSFKLVHPLATELGVGSREAGPQETRSDHETSQNGRN